MTIYSLVTFLFQYGKVSCSISDSNCCSLTCIQFSQESGKVIWYSHLFKNFPQFVVIHTVKGFSTVNATQVDVFLERLCFLHDPVNIGNFISSSSAFSKSSLCIWKFSVQVLLKPILENFEYYFLSMWNECNCVVVWIFFGIGLLWDWNENIFSSPVATTVEWHSSFQKVKNNFSPFYCFNTLGNHLLMYLGYVRKKTTLTVISFLTLPRSCQILCMPCFILCLWSHQALKLKVK